MIFTTHVLGIPCQCQVLNHPPQGDTLEVALFDLSGHPAPWLSKYLTPIDHARLLNAYRFELRAEFHTEPERLF